MTEEKSLAARRRGRKEGFAAELVWVMEMFYILIFVIIMQLQTPVKTYNTIYLKGLVLFYINDTSVNLIFKKRMSSFYHPE